MNYQEWQRLIYEALDEVDRCEHAVMYAKEHWWDTAIPILHLEDARAHLDALRRISPVGGWQDVNE